METDRVPKSGALQRLAGARLLLTGEVGEAGGHDPGANPVLQRERAG